MPAKRTRDTNDEEPAAIRTTKRSRVNVKRNPTALARFEEMQTTKLNQNASRSTDNASQEKMTEGPYVPLAVSPTQNVTPVNSENKSVVPEPPTEFNQVSDAAFMESYKVEGLTGAGTGADVYYQPDLIDEETADEWYKELLKLDTWYRPTLKVYGKSIVQSRAIAAYATSPSMTLKYSGQTVDMHYPYPPLIASMQSMVEKALGGDVRFNHVMLNLYERGDVYIGKHSDHLDNKVIASVSLGAERTFIMSPRKDHPGKTYKWKLKNGSMVVMQGDTQKNWKHEIPKEPKILEGRISLTFRQLC